MSKKRFNPLEDPPTASSSDDEDDEMEAAAASLAGKSSSEEEETDDESSKNPPLKKAAESSPAEKQQQQASDSGSGSGSDEETDSDSQTERKNPVSPVVVKKDSAVVVVVKKKNQDSKKVKPLSKCSTKKRSLSETDGGGGGAASTEAKKKPKSGSSGEEAKKSYFQRVWSEEDEIAALQGLIDYRNDTGASPYDDTNSFYLSVKKSISFDVSKTQLLKKLWGLKTKYENNVGKEKNGEELSFSRPHDRKAFDLSKLFWGGDGVVALDSAVKSNGKSKKSSKSSSSKKTEPEPEKVALDSANGKSKKSSKSPSSKKVEPEKQELASSSPPDGKSCEDEVVTNKGDGVAEVDALEKSVLVKALARFGVDDLSAQLGWSRLALEDKKRFEEEWKVLQLKELEFYSQKSGFIHEVVTKMAESFQPNP